MSYTIRNAEKADKDRIMQIYSSARRRMAEGGNPDQWGNVTPAETLVDEDLEARRNYVVCSGEDICGVFALFSEPDPTYAYIEGPGWLSDRPYLTIHRIARDDSSRGVFNAVLEYVGGFGKDIRIDTHRDNAPMLHILRSKGFKECGIIYLANGSPRIAFQKTAEEQARSE